MKLEEMLGDSFHDGMSIEEINTALSGKKFADLSTGNYVDKNKYEADLRAKDDVIKNKEAALESKMSDAEKDLAEQKKKDARLEELENLLKNQTIENSKNKAEALTSDIKSILGIDSNDEKYSSFINNISYDKDKVSTIAAYVNQIVKDSYEKGKQSATKDKLGSFADGVDKSGSGKSVVGDFGKRLAESQKSTMDPNLYFKK